MYLFTSSPTQTPFNFDIMFKNVEFQDLEVMIQEQTFPLGTYIFNMRLDRVIAVMIDSFVAFCL